MGSEAVERVVASLFADLRGRSGFHPEVDAETMAEWRREWVTIVDAAFAAGAASRDEEVKRLMRALDELIALALLASVKDDSPSLVRARAALAKKPTDGSSPPKEGQGA